MRKIYLEDRNNVLADAASQFEVTTNMAKADALLTWNDLLIDQRSNIRVAQAHKIPTLMMEHGMTASHDYLEEYADGQTNQNGNEFIADYYLAWGEYGKDNLIKAGVDKSNIKVVGSPAIWDVKYVYGVEGAEIKFSSYEGKEIKDPVSGNIIQFMRREAVKPTNKKRALVVYFPHHDWTALALRNCSLVYEQIKDRKDIFVKTTNSYNNTKEENPFKDLLNMPYDDRVKHALFIDPNVQQNMQVVLNLLSVASCVVTDIPGTINGIAAAMNVPCVVPKLDYLLQKGGEICYNELPSDYLCELEDLDSTIDFAIKYDDRKEQRDVVAKKYMGNDKDPYVEIGGIINGL